VFARSGLRARPRRPVVPEVIAELGHGRPRATHTFGTRASEMNMLQESHAFGTQATFAGISTICNLHDAALLYNNSLSSYQYCIH